MSNRDNHNDQRDVSRIDIVVTGIEDLRSKLVDLEAMAHAAAQSLEYIPFAHHSYENQDTATISERGSHQGSRPRPYADKQIRLQLGRLQALVVATAEAAYAILHDANEVLKNHGGGSSGACESDSNGSRPGLPILSFGFPPLEGFSPSILPR